MSGSEASPQAHADGGGDAPIAASRARSLMGRLRVGQWVMLIVSVLAVVLVAGVIVGGTALSRESDARQEILDQLDPARSASLELSAAVIAQQNAVRGFALSGRSANLEEFAEARALQDSATAELSRLSRDAPELTPRIAEISRTMESWRTQFAMPAIERVRREGPAASVLARARRAAASFAQVTSALTEVRQAIAERRADAVQRLEDASRSMTASFYAIAGVLALLLIGVAIVMRQAISRPLERLASHARVVAGGNLEHRLAGEGPADVVQLADHVDSMRLRILSDLEEVQASRVLLEGQARELEDKARDLERSNSELEQFAYVASHDLQEPLRKVASFCQLLQRRYQGQLDERADTYIEYAVDGAKRMQALITDLLAFSRVGRIETELVEVALDDTVRGALGNLTSRIEGTQARIDVGPLPVVAGEPLLLTAVFQNLIGNSLKFHGDEPPVIRVHAERAGDEWIISCSDEGIGIDSAYAERIFAIFQRLHPKETYEGTGIGLALTRKIVEHHGGRIWLDTDVPAGATFRFTLPARLERSS